MEISGCLTRRWTRKMCKVSGGGPKQKIYQQKFYIRSPWEKSPRREHEFNQDLTDI